MDETAFDQLTKRLGSTSSRRQALRLLGGAISAGMLGLTRQTTLADGNSAAARWCYDSFSGRDAGQCTSDAAHGTGLALSACGPTGSGGTLMGDTSNYDSTFCCPSARICGGACLESPCDASQCLTCAADSGRCASTCTGDLVCNGAGGCVQPCTLDSSLCTEDQLCDETNGCIAACTLGTDTDCAHCGDACTGTTSCSGGTCVQRCTLDAGICTADETCNATNGCVAACDLGTHDHCLHCDDACAADQICDATQGCITAPVVTTTVQYTFSLNGDRYCRLHVEGDHFTPSTPYSVHPGIQFKDGGYPTTINRSVTSDATGHFATDSAESTPSGYGSIGFGCVGNICSADVPINC